MKTRHYSGTDVLNAYQKYLRKGNKKPVI